MCQPLKGKRIAKDAKEDDEERGLDSLEVGFNIRIRIYPDNPVIREKLFVSGYFSSEYPNTIRIYPSNSNKFSVFDIRIITSPSIRKTPVEIFFVTPASLPVASVLALNLETWFFSGRDRTQD